MKRITMIAAIAILGGCAASKEAQVLGALGRAGVPQAMAACMAPPLARDLTAAQLRNLGKVARTARTNAMEMTPQMALDTLRRDIDPDTVAVVVRTGLGCLVRG